jgi:hypothetical protein
MLNILASTGNVPAIANSGKPAVANWLVNPVHQRKSAPLAANLKCMENHAIVGNPQLLW